MSNFFEIGISAILCLVGLGLLLFENTGATGDAVYVESPEYKMESKSTESEKIIIEADPKFSSEMEHELYEQRTIITEQMDQVDEIDEKLEGIIKELGKEK